MANNGKVTITKEKAELTQEQLLQRHNSDKHENVIQDRQRKIGLVTEGLDRYLRTQLTEQVALENANIICGYIVAQKTEKNISNNYRASIISGLIMLCKFHKNIVLSKYYIKRENGSSSH